MPGEEVEVRVSSGALKIYVTPPVLESMKRHTQHADRSQKARYGSWSEGMGRMERHYAEFSTPWRGL